MTERLPKEDRQAVSVEAGQRMAVFMEDPLVLRWFEKERESLMADMMSDALDTDRIQALMMAIKTLDSLQRAMKHAVTVSKNIQKEMDAKEGAKNV